jgi:CubicO group peptidase (beta-lactamase class C family)
LDLDRDVNAYLKSWKVPENEFTRTEKVTTRRLLSHTAGLTVRGFRGYPAGAPVPTLLQVLDGLPPANSEPIRVDQVPGAGFRYSGGGFTVLQQLLEDVTGQSLADLARERVFAPLGMTHSSIGVPPSPATPLELSMAHLPNAVPGYRFLPGGSGCCEWWTTPADLATFAIAIQRSLRGDTGTVLSQASARLMVTPVAGRPTGLGFFVNNAGNTRYFEHSGGNPGFSSMLVATVDGGHGAVVLENAGSSSGFVGEVLTSIGAAYGLAGLQTVNYQSSADLVAAYKQAKAIRPDDPMVAEAAVNALGYRLLRNNMREEAVQVFQLNTELYPDSANAEDSLAEAHENAGHLEAALAHYRLAIDKLDRHGARNTGYERNRAAAQSKIADLTARFSKKLGR